MSLGRTAPLRVANMSGYYGDRLSAARDLLEAERLDVITGDYLAELTMYLLYKARKRDPAGGFARTFLTQAEEILGTCIDRDIRIVTNAGGLNPAGLAEQLHALSERLGIGATIAWIGGDDVVDRIPGWLEEGLELAHLDTGRALADLRAPIATANAYLGGWGIREAIVQGADVVVCPRVTDAALVLGPAAAAFGWTRTDWDHLAGAVVCGHVLECGPQTTGGNFSFFTEVEDLSLPGFPIAELLDDGSSIITKAAGAAGAVTVDTVTAQLVYEIAGARYANPDVVARFDTIHLEQVGVDRVLVSGVRGEPPPRETKLALNYVGGYRNEMTLVITGLDVERKAELAMQSLHALWGDTEFDELHVDLLRADRQARRRNEDACAFLRVTVKDRDREKAGRWFSDAFVQAALSSYPGLFLSTPPQRATEYAVYWPTLIASERVAHTVTWWDGPTLAIAPTSGLTGNGEVQPTALPTHDGVATIEPYSPAEQGDLVRTPLGRVFGTRSGDKGGNANLGVWARTDEQYAWLVAYLTCDRLADLLPDAGEYPIERHVLPNIRAVNFVIHGLLGDGAAATVRLDRQAKGLGEYLGCQEIDIPGHLVTDISPCHEEVAPG